MTKSKEQHAIDLCHVLEVVLEVDPVDGIIKKALDYEGITCVEEIVNMPPSKFDSFQYEVKESDGSTIMKSLLRFSIAFLNKFQQFVHYHQHKELWTNITRESYMEFVCSGIDPSTIPPEQLQ